MGVIKINPITHIPFSFLLIALELKASKIDRTMKQMDVNNPIAIIPPTSFQ